MTSVFQVEFISEHPQDSEIAAIYGLSLTGLLRRGTLRKRLLNSLWSHHYRSQSGFTVSEGSPGAKGLGRCRGKMTDTRYAYHGRVPIFSVVNPSETPLP